MADDEQSRAGTRGHDLCMIIADLSAGGAQRVFSGLANHWAAAGLRICVVTMSRPEDDFFPLHPTIDRLSIGGLGASRGLIDQLRANLGRVARLRGAMRQAKAPCVVSFVGTMNILCILAAMGLGLRVVVSERNDPARQSLGRPWDTLRRWLYRRADAVTANSQGALDSLGTYVPEGRLALVPNPLPALPAGVVVDRSARRIVNVGRLNRQKAQDVLLRAFASARSSGSGRDWELVIVGEGEERAALERLSAELELGNAVRFTGRVDDPFEHYANAGIFALPSRYEGTPNALLEAMACGLPVIVSDSSAGPLDCVTHDQTGLVVSVDDVEALARALSVLMDDEALRGRLGEAAKSSLAGRNHAAAYGLWEGVLGLSVPAAGASARPQCEGGS